MDKLFPLPFFWPLSFTDWWCSSDNFADMWFVSLMKTILLCCMYFSSHLHFRCVCNCTHYNNLNVHGDREFINSCILTTYWSIKIQSLLVGWLLMYVPLKKVVIIWRRHRSADEGFKFLTNIFSAHGLSKMRVLRRFTSTVTVVFNALFLGT